MAGSNNDLPLSRFKLGAALLLVLLGALNVSLAHANDEDAVTGNINVFLGTKALDEDDWFPTENQREGGIDFDSRLYSMPVNLVLTLRWSEDDGVDPSFGSETLTGRTAEYGAGVRKIFDTLPIVRPYLGGGLALFTYEGVIADLNVVETDAAAGLWFDGGVYVTVAGHLNIGVQARLSWAPEDLLGLDLNTGPVDPGGVHLGLLAGYHF